MTDQQQTEKPTCRIGSIKQDTRNGRTRHEMQGALVDTFPVVFSANDSLILNMSEEGRTWHVIINGKDFDLLRRRFAEFEADQAAKAAKALSHVRMASEKTTFPH